MYLSALFVHSWLRWAVLLLGLAVVVRAMAGSSNDRLARAFVAALDLQVLLGLALYFFLSPVGRPSLLNIEATMQHKVLRFWGIEHATGMLVALVLAHVGNVLVKRAVDDATRQRRRLIWTLAPLATILLTIPWPFLPYGRPLMRLWS